MKLIILAIICAGICLAHAEERSGNKVQAKGRDQSKAKADAKSRDQPKAKAGAKGKVETKDRVQVKNKNQSKKKVQPKKKPQTKKKPQKNEASRVKDIQELQTVAMFRRCVQNPDNDDCGGKPETAYYYSANTNTCRKYTYRGCRNSKNKFKSESSCVKSCNPLAMRTAEAIAKLKLACTLPPDQGVKCKTAKPMRRFYFDGIQCRAITYNGCGGNQNLFKGLSTCNSMCTWKKFSNKNVKLDVSEDSAVGAALRFLRDPAVDPNLLTFDAEDDDQALLSFINDNPDFLHNDNNDNPDFLNDEDEQRFFPNKDVVFSDSLIDDVNNNS